MNTGFSLSTESGGVYLFNAAGVRVDSVEYGFQVVNVSIGRTAADWHLLASPTPNAANAAAAILGATAALRLNEWMSEDPSGDDWFQIYNPAPSPVSLAGLHVTDDPSIVGVTKHQLAPLSFVGAGDFVKLHASGEVGRGRNHVPFNLNRFGDALRLYGTNLAMIDSADLVVLPAGVSAGRLPDGSVNTLAFYTAPSPAAGNYLPPARRDDQRSAEPLGRAAGRCHRAGEPLGAIGRHQWFLPQRQWAGFEEVSHCRWHDGGSWKFPGVLRESVWERGQWFRAQLLARRFGVSLWSGCERESDRLSIHVPFRAAGERSVVWPDRDQRRG